MKGRTRFFHLVAIGALFGGLCLGCRQAGQPRATNDQSTVVIGLNADFDTFLELATANSDALHVIEEMLFLTLFDLDENLGIVPRLASSWQFSADHREATIRLRDDVFWTDGTPTTAADVLFTYQTAINPAAGYPGISRFDQVDSLVAEDPFTLRCYFKSSYPDALYDLRIPILPKHLLQDVPPEQLRESPFNRQPVGNGPYVLQEWRANDRVVFTANKSFYGGAPEIDRIVFRIIPESSVMLTSLDKGEIDFTPYVAPNQLAQLEAQADLRIQPYPDRGYSFLAFNMRRPLFQDVRLRQAIALAIDRNEILQTLLKGKARLVSGPVPPYFSAYDPTRPANIFSPDSARKLLAAADWRDSDGDGWLDKDGQKLSFIMKTNADNQLRSDMLVMMQAHLEKIGVQAQPELLEMGRLVEDVLQKRDFDAVLLSWKTGFTINPAQIWHSDAIGNGYNLSGYSSAAVDSLLAAGRAEMEPANARDAWRAFQQAVIDDMPYVFLFMQENPGVVNRRLRNVLMDVRGYLINVESWSLTPTPDFPGSGQ